MFVGHLAVSLGSKALEPRASLALLIAASFGIDLLWPILLLAELEVVQIDPGNTAFTPLAFESYPWSHSLLLVLCWGAVGGMLSYWRTATRRIALVVGAVLVSHWLLDFLTHRPDLPLWPGGPEVGLGLWNSIPGTLVLEGGLLITAVGLYSRKTRPTDRTGSWALWSLIAFLGIIWMSQPWSPPAPNATVVAATALGLWILPAWGYWIDRHRKERLD